MKIASETNERYAQYEDLIRKCLMSRGTRRRFYQSMRNYYMYGSDGTSDAPSRWNKIYPHIQMLSSFLYSQETTRFSINIGASVSDMERPKIGPLNQGINEEWNSSNTDIQYGNALEWALVYSSTFIKPRWKVNGIEPFVVEPHNFGVLREDSPQLSTQEAFCHTYYTTRSQLLDELKEADHPRIQAIMNEVIAGPKQTVSSASPLDRIITSQSSPSVIGNVDFNLALTTRYSPAVAEDLVEMTELYVFDSSIMDYRVVTLADPYVIVYDRPLDGMFLRNEAPFIQVCPVPTYDYFWGFSEVERLVPLQELLNQRLEEIRHILAKQARPPKSFSGYQGITDEIAFAFDTPGGTVTTDMPGAKVDQMDTPVAPDLWVDVDRIVAMFEETSGINNVMQGKGDSGVRSSGQTSQLARLGSSRVKKRAMIIEDSLELLATVYLKLKQKYDKRRYRAAGEKGAEGGEEFIAHQFTDDFVVKVDGHSNSPIFMEDQTQIAFELFKSGAITKARLLELVNVPMRAQLIHDVLTIIQPAEEKKAEDEHQEKMAAIAAKQNRMS